MTTGDHEGDRLATETYQLDVGRKSENSEAENGLRPRKTAMAGGARERPSPCCGIKHADDDDDD